MRKLLIAIILLPALLVLGKGKREIKDTLRVVTLQKFKVPSDRNIVLKDILGFAVKASITDENGKVLRKVTKIWQSMSNAQFKRKTRGGRGVTIQFAFFDSVETPGNYFVVVRFKVIDENRRRHVLPPIKYMLNVNYPTLASPVNLRNGQPYYYSETKSFSVATIEFSDPNKYSYQIFDEGNNVIQKGNGPIVKLDKVFNTIDYVGQTLKIVAKYAGKEYFYITNSSKKPQKSEWQVKLAVPPIDKFGDWTFSANNDGKPGVIAWDSPSARQILYTIDTQTADKNFVFIAPDIRGVQVVSDPPGLVKLASISQAGAFVYLNLDYDDAVFQQNAQGSDDCPYIQTVTLHVTFDTQFPGVSLDETYTAALLR